MSLQPLITLRSKKLGVLIRDSRLAAHKTISECAGAIGVSNGIFQAYEKGSRSPSLPELEILAFFFNIPIHQFWGKKAISDDVSPTDSLNRPAIILIRQRMIGAIIRQKREDASLSVKILSEQSGIPPRRIKAYELGDRPIPIPVLERLLTILNGNMETLIDRTGPIGEWLAQQDTVKDFAKLPPEIREFVCKPVNFPYLKLAMKLSDLSTERLRSVAEGLLDITY